MTQGRSGSLLKVTQRERAPARLLCLCSGFKRHAASDTFAHLRTHAHTCVFLGVSQESSNFAKSFLGTFRVVSLFVFFKAMNAWNDALFAAAQRGQVDRVKALLANANMQDAAVQDRDTAVQDAVVQDAMSRALHIAIHNDFPKVVRVLCEASCGLAIAWSFSRIRHLRDFQPIHLAASVGSAACIAELVLHFRVPTQSINREDDTPLHRACRHEHVEAVRQLLALHAETDACNAIGWTPLETAAAKGYIRVVAALAQSRLHPQDIYDALRRVARDGGHSAIVDILQRVQKTRRK